MFELQPKRGVWDSWVERTREWRGIDQWPIVEAQVLNNVNVETGEGNNRKLELTYTAPEETSGVRPLVVIWLSTPAGSDASLAKRGDVISLRVNPGRPDKAVFLDTSGSASGLVVAVIFFALFLGIFMIRGCKL